MRCGHSACSSERDKDCSTHSAYAQYLLTKSFGAAEWARFSALKARQMAAALSSCATDAVAN